MCTETEEDELEWALSLALEYLEKYYPDYETDDKIQTIVDIHNNIFS